MIVAMSQLKSKQLQLKRVYQKEIVIVMETNSMHLVYVVEIVWPIQTEMEFVMLMRSSVVQMRAHVTSMLWRHKTTVRVFILNMRMIVRAYV